MIRLMAACVCLFMAVTQGEAHGHGRHHHTSRHVVAVNHDSFVRHHRGYRGAVAVAHHRASHRITAHHFSDGRPSAWCGWQMRQWKGGGPELNLARNWARVGTASGPQVGAIVVWAHHVGLITGRAGNGEWIIKSGNDGHQVRERPRSIGGAIAFRMV